MINFLDSTTPPLQGAAILARLAALGAAGVKFGDDVFRIAGSSDATKLAAFEVDGFTAGTTRTFTLPNANVVVAGSASALTSGRIPYATTGGLLLDDSDLTFDGTTLTLGTNGVLAINKTTGATLTVASTTVSTTTTTGCATFAGGIGVVGTSVFGDTLTITRANTSQLIGVNTAASGSAAGATFVVRSDDGAANGSGDRLGGFFFSGSTAASTYINGGALTCFTTEAWGASAGGTQFVLETCANGSTSRTTRMTWDQDGLVYVGAGTTGAMALQASMGAYPSNLSGVFLSRTASGGSAPFDEAGHVIIIPRTTTSNSRDFIVATGNTNPTESFRVTRLGSVSIGNAAIATNATDGFLYVPTCAGTPTGSPTTITGRAPIVVNTTNNKLYFYSGGAWRDAGP